MSRMAIIDFDHLELVADGTIVITWTCPRCDRRQTRKVLARALLFGAEITCESCGRARFELELALVSGDCDPIRD